MCEHVIQEVEPKWFLKGEKKKRKEGLASDLIETVAINTVHSIN